MLAQDRSRRLGYCLAAAYLVSGSVSAANLITADDVIYRGAFRLPGGETPPQTFAYGGNAMTFNPDGDPDNTDAYPGSLFVMGHDRMADGALPDGNQLAEIDIPEPAIEEDPAELPQAGVLQGFQDVLVDQFHDMDEIPKVGLAYLDHPLTGPKLHVAWGQHLQPEDAPSHGWLDPVLTDPDFQGTWFIGTQNLYSVNGYLFEIPADWADAYAQGRYLATGRMRDGGQGGMGPALFAYRPWQDDGSPPPSGTHLAETPLLLYENAYNSADIVRAMAGYQHPDEWEGGEWLTTGDDREGLLFAGTKSNGAKYWYGYINALGPDHPCVDDEVTDFVTCRLASGAACPAADFVGCCDESAGTCVSDRGWWSTRFDAELILYDPAALAHVASGAMQSWQPQPYARLDIDDHLVLNPPVWDEITLGTGVQRRYRIGDAAFDPAHGLLYVLERYADGGKPVVHVWQIIAEHGGRRTPGIRRDVCDSTAVTGPVRHVALSGNDATADGSAERPYRTLAAAVTAVNETEGGETVLVHGGTYAEPSEIRIRVPDVTIRSVPGEWAVIDRTAADEWDAGIYFYVGSDGGALSCIEVNGGFYVVSTETKWDWGDPDDRGGASRIRIENTRLHGSYADVIKIKPNSDDIQIRFNEIFDSGIGQPADDCNAEGIDNVNGDRTLVAWNHIHDICSTGVYLKGGATDGVIEYNLIERAGAAGILLGFDTSPEFFDLEANPDYFENIRGIARYNLIRDTGWAGIGFYAAKEAQAYNNTIIDAASLYHSPLYFGVTFQDWEPEAGRPASTNPVIFRNVIVNETTAPQPPMVQIRYANELGGLSGLAGNPAMYDNCYFQTVGDIEFSDGRDGGWSGDLSAWQSHIQGDAGAFAGDPLLDADDQPLSPACAGRGYHWNVPLFADRRAGLAGLNDSGQIFHTLDLTLWQEIPGTLADLLVGDLDGDGSDDLAGLTGDGRIYVSTDRTTWRWIPGTLAQLMSGDLDGDGTHDLIGLTETGLIYVTTNLETWTWIPGTLTQLTVGDLDGDGRADLAGLNSNGEVYVSTDRATWQWIPGTLARLITADLDGNGREDLIGLNADGFIFGSTDRASWTWIPGVLEHLIAADLNGDGQADLAGLSAAGGIFFSLDRASWTPIPGILSDLIAADLDGDGLADLAGLNAEGDIFHTIDLETWKGIPGRLLQIRAGRFR